MTRFCDALGRFSVRFRYPIVLVWLAGAVAAAQLLPTLASAVDNFVLVLLLLLVVFRSLLAPALTLLPLEPEAERAATPS
jgi:uncharacterized membrane protein YdfJ with MMPL/SSD domain